MKRQDNLIANIDWTVVAIYLVLTVFGWLNVYAVTASREVFFGVGSASPAFMQLVWIGISLVVVFVIFLLDSRFFSFMAYPLYGFFMFLLMLVLLIGTAKHGAKSWIVMGPVSLQPSEFAKLASMLAVARFMSAYNYKMSRFRDLVITFALIGFPALLVLAQPDFGSFLVFMAFLLVLYREGLSGWVLIVVGGFALLFLTTLIVQHHNMHYILLISLGTIALIVYTILARKPIVLLIISAISGILVVLIQFFVEYDILKLEKDQIVWITLLVVSLIALIYGIKEKKREIFMIVGFLAFAVIFTYSVVMVFKKLPDHHQDRINIMLGLIPEDNDKGYNVEQSMIAIGSGQFIGKGFLQGTQTEGRFVPEQPTDFIFTSVGEQFGFLGSFGLVALYTLLLVRLVIIAERQRSRFSRIVGYGVVSVLLFHLAVNISMTIGIFPTIGIPLPFLSYGGSSFLAFTMMLFILIRLDASRKTYLV
ncbi:MAG: rod shape-determining protein RodA [Bacteroidales bacterium]|nr:rod shape-determining protein RodA [Bacteroidales bacterium]